MIDIAIIGAGGFGREVKCLIEDINNSTQQLEKYNIIGFYDDGVEKGTKIHNHVVLGKVSDVNNYSKSLDVVVAIGTPKTKKNVISSITNKLIQYPNLIHPSVIKSKNNVVLGKGNIITAGCILTCDITIENFVILNLACTVGHDTLIKSYSSFMPSVNISGEVVINEQVYVGTGVKIINQLEIGFNTIVGAGALVSKTLPENCTAVGIPAKPIKFHE